MSSLVLIYSQTSSSQNQSIENTTNKVISSDLISTHPHYCQSFQSVVLPICKDGNSAYFDDALSILKTLSMNERFLMENFITIVKIMLVNDTTVAAPERLFSMARRIKTWLHSTMTYQKFDTSILNSNKSLVDKLLLVKVASDFAKSCESCKNDFGVSREEDLK